MEQDCDVVVIIIPKTVPFCAGILTPHLIHGSLGPSDTHKPPNSILNRFSHF